MINESSAFVYYTNEILVMFNRIPELLILLSSDCRRNPEVLHTIFQQIRMNFTVRLLNAMSKTDLSKRILVNAIIITIID